MNTPQKALLDRIVAMLTKLAHVLYLKGLPLAHDGLRFEGNG